MRIIITGGTGLIGRSLGQALVAEGRARREDFPFDSDGYRPPTNAFIDGIEYNGRQPNAYLTKFAIGLKDKDLDGATTD